MGCEADRALQQNDSSSPSPPSLSEEVAPRMQWAKSTTFGPSGSTKACAARARTRSEVRQRLLKFCPMVRSSACRPSQRRHLYLVALLMLSIANEHSSCKPLLGCQVS